MDTGSPGLAAVNGRLARLAGQVAALYLATGLLLAIIFGLVIGALKMERHLEDWVQKIEDLQEIMGYGVMSTTSAVVIDGKVVYAFDVPARSKVESWF